jgi:TATA binding protein of transcription factor TFIID
MVNPTETIEIQNVVASTGIGQELDLEALATDMPGAEFNPDNFPDWSTDERTEGGQLDLPLGEDCLYRGVKHGGSAQCARYCLRKAS